jgi:hypothetical protein
MVDAVGPARADDSQVVCTLSDVRQEIGDWQTALAIATKDTPGAQEWICRDLSTSCDTAKARREGLSAQTLKVRFGIKGLQMAGPAVHEEVDDTSRPGREMRSPTRQWIGP